MSSNPTRSESQLQAKCYQWFHNTYPEQRKRLFMIHNNPANRVQGNRLRAMGMVKGVADMEYLTSDGRPVFIEFKIDNNTQSPEQIEFEQVCIELGIPYFVIKTFDDFCNLLESFM